MGTLFCQRCGGQADGSTRKEADDKIDHAVGQIRGRPCSGKQSDLHWTGDQKSKEQSKIIIAEETITESKKSKKTKKSKRE